MLLRSNDVGMVHDSHNPHFSVDEFDFIVRLSLIDHLDCKLFQSALIEADVDSCKSALAKLFTQLVKVL